MSSVLDVLFAVVFITAGDCEVSLNSVQFYEDEALRASARGDDQALENSIKCLLLNADQLRGIEQAVADRFVSGLLGREIGTSEDKTPYLKFQKALEKRLQEASQPLSSSFLRRVSEMKSQQLKPFCQGGKEVICKTFLPTNEQILSASPMMSVVFLMVVKDAADRFPREVALELKDQIRSLRSRSEVSPLLKKALDEISDEWEKPHLISPIG